MTGKATRLVVVALVTLGFSVPIAATSRTAHAANGQCQYGQKSDGTCWDAQAKMDGQCTADFYSHTCPQPPVPPRG